MGVVIQLSPPPPDPPSDSLAAGHHFTAGKPTDNAFATLYCTNFRYGLEMVEQPTSRADEGQLILLDALVDAYQSQSRDGRTLLQNQRHIINFEMTPSPPPGINAPPAQPVISNAVKRLPVEFRCVPVEADSWGATYSISTLSEAAYSTPHTSV